MRIRKSPSGPFQGDAFATLGIEQVQANDVVVAGTAQNVITRSFLFAETPRYKTNDTLLVEVSGIATETNAAAGTFEFTADIAAQTATTFTGGILAPVPFAASEVKPLGLSFLITLTAPSPLIETDYPVDFNLICTRTSGTGELTFAAATFQALITQLRAIP